MQPADYNELKNKVARLESQIEACEMRELKLVEMLETLANTMKDCGRGKDYGRWQTLETALSEINEP